MTSEPLLPPFGALSRARNAGSRDSRIILACQVLRVVCKLGFSGSTAILVGRLIMQEPVTPLSAALPLVMLALTAGLNWLADDLQAKAEMQVANTVRGSAMERLASMSARMVQEIPAGQLATAVQRHPEAIAALVISHRVATLMMAVAPLMAAAALLVVSWQAALLVLLLTPVMIVFFVLVGDAIRRRAETQERAFGRLAGQFADRIRTLPTILANHGLPQEEAKLKERLNTYADRTMGVLRIAFVNAAIIDFFASLSIAMLAVFLGLGHLKLAMIPGFHNLELWQSLFILMIAPDYFAPYRRFSEQYHAKAEGTAAATALDSLLDRQEPEQPAIVTPQLDLPHRGLIALVGPSGCGKSTLLRRIAGIERGHDAFAAAIDGREISWVSTDAAMSAGTLREVLAGRNRPCETRLKWAADKVGLLDDVLLPGGLDAQMARGGMSLSGGQRLRVAVARSLLIGGVVLADEPTAKLDQANAAKVRKALAAMSQARLVVVATHDPLLAARADRVIDLDSSQKFENAA